MSLKFAICNLGCKVNNFETNWYSQQLSKKYEEVDFKEFADIYIINTCTVTNTAGSKSRQMMHKARKQNPDGCVAVVGCYVQMEQDNTEIFEDCDIIIGSKYKTKLPELIDYFLENHQKINMTEKFEKTDFEEMFIQNFNQTRAYLKIQDGCNQFCSYCTIPFARGRERCLNADAAIEQAKTLVENGHIEIVLTGIHTGRYNDNGLNLTGLIKRMLNEVSGLQRIRISSIEMTEVTDELIELMSKEKRIAKHLHIPLQTGNDRLLKLNNRPYKIEDYYNKVIKIRELIPDCSISSDVIVGLPQETDEEFSGTLSFIEKCELSFTHVFPYARKKGTVDYSLPGQVDEVVKKQRVGNLTNLSNNLYNKYAEKFLNKTVDVLFETYQMGLNRGHCSQYIPTVVSSENCYAHKMCKVYVDGVDGNTLIGHIVE